MGPDGILRNINGAGLAFWRENGYDEGKEMAGGMDMQSAPQSPLTSLIKGQMFEGLLLVRNAEQRTASNGSKYLDITLGDKSGEFNGKMWDGTVAAPKTGEVVKVRALLQEYNGRPQLRVDKMRVVPKEEVDLTLFVPCAPRPGEEMLSEILERVEKIQDEDLKKVVSYRLEESGERLLYYPAASKLHHAERAGLLHHTSTMLKMADSVCDLYETLDRDLLCAGVILHDLDKLREIKADDMGVASEYTVEGMLLGHLVQGAVDLGRVCDKLGVRDEVRIMLSHMLISHHDLPEYGSPKRPMFPEAEALHIIDLLDARMYEMNLALKAATPGGFTEKIWSLERRLYRREKQEKDEE